MEYACYRARANGVRPILAMLWFMAIGYSANNTER